MTLELLICTIDRGIDNVKNLLLVPIAGVSYLVSWQHSNTQDSREIPAELVRDDVRVVHLEGRGLSRNRNNAIDNASGDICLISDDDCTYRPEYFENILNTFRENSTLDIAVFRMKSSYENKFYPSWSYNPKKRVKCHNIASIEIAFRRASLQGYLHFNELFGLGSPVFQSGEEGIFMVEAIKSGLICEYHPLIVVEHDHPSTSTTRVANIGYIMGEGAYVSRAFPWTAFIRVPLMAYRLNKQNQLGVFCNLRHLIAGIIYLHRNS